MMLSKQGLNEEPSQILTRPAGPAPFRAASVGPVPVEVLSRPSGSYAAAVDDAWAKAVELLGPGTITRDQAEAILRAGLARIW